MDGISFRNLANTFEISVGSAHAYVKEELAKLPHCADVTRKYCNKSSGIFLVDGKYLKVKNYQRKIPVLYGIDYQSHDIPTYVLSISENYQTCAKFFNSLKLLDYQIMVLICDDNINIHQAFEYYYPRASIQLCLTHYKENLRQRLEVRKISAHVGFMRSIEFLLSKKRSEEDFNRIAQKIFLKYSKTNLYANIVFDIERRKEYLTGYRGIKHCPSTNNLIESFNSHLEGRLKTIKGFESFAHAKLWLNGYFLRRRTKIFTDCTGKFRRLNGKTSLEIVKKSGIDLPSFF